jgi:hypothetical protein
MSPHHEEGSREVSFVAVLHWLENNLCLDPVLHVVLRSSSTFLCVEIRHISLQLQVVLVEVVRDSTDHLILHGSDHTRNNVRKARVPE